MIGPIIMVGSQKFSLIIYSQKLQTIQRTFNSSRVYTVLLYTVVTKYLQCTVLLVVVVVYMQ